FRLATADEISRLINQAFNKQCDLDPIPMSLLKQCCRSSQTLSICLFPPDNFHLSSNRLLSLLCSRNQALTENHYLTTGQSQIFPLSQNSLNESSKTVFMNTCRITPCSILSNLLTQSFIPLNLP